MAPPPLKPVVLVLQPGLVIEGLAAEPLGTGATYQPTSYAPTFLHAPSAQYTALLSHFKLISRPVRVRVPGRADPLYGLISFHELPSSAHGPASRSYAITVPQSYVDQATGGRVSVVYELVPHGMRNVASLPGGAYQSSDALGWVLFLSDRPM